MNYCVYLHGHFHSVERLYKNKSERDVSFAHFDCARALNLLVKIFSTSSTVQVLQPKP